MDVLSYSPKVEAYAAVGRNGDYVDLTPDIVHTSVTRVSNGASTATVRLQNVGDKYNGYFMPFDRIAIFATKISRYPIFTGYINDVPAYSMYGTDVTVSAKCPIYRLQKLYWDSSLFESQKLLGFGGNAKSWDEVIFNLLIDACGIPEQAIAIGDVPQELIGPEGYMPLIWMTQSNSKIWRMRSSTF